MGHHLLTQPPLRRRHFCARCGASASARSRRCGCGQVLVENFWRIQWDIYFKLLGYNIFLTIMDVIYIYVHIHAIYLQLPPGTFFGLFSQTAGLVFSRVDYNKWWGIVFASFRHQTLSGFLPGRYWTKGSFKEQANLWGNNRSFVPQENAGISAGDILWLFYGLRTSYLGNLPTINILNNMKSNVPTKMEM